MQTCYTRLMDLQWEDIKEIFALQRKRKHSLRAVVDAILRLLRLGGQWRNLPEQLAIWQVKWRWVTERAFGTFNFIRRLNKNHEKTTASTEAWVLWQNCRHILNRKT